MAVEVVEAIEVTETDEVNEAAEVSKAWKITAEDIQDLELNFILMFGNYYFLLGS